MLGTALPGSPCRILREPPLLRKPTRAEGLTIHCYAIVSYSLPWPFCCIIGIYNAYVYISSAAFA